MAFYFVTKYAEDLDGVTCLARKAKLSTPILLKAGEWTVLYSKKRNEQISNQLIEGENHWALAVGAFVYRSEFGAKALKRAAEDLREGKFSFDDCMGHFNLLSYQRETGKFYLVTDKSGLYKCYGEDVSPNPARISSSFLAIVKCLRNVTLNQQACTEFVSNNMTLGRQCFVDGVVKLRPRAVTELTSGKKRKWEIIPSYPEVSTREFSHFLKERYEFLRHLSLPVWADLSMGYDTRLIAAILNSLKFDYRFNVNGSSHADSVDVEGAKAIALAERREIVVFPADHALKIRTATVPLEEKLALLESAFYTYDGLRSPFESAASATLFESKAQYIGFLVGGHGGELFRPYYDKVLVPHVGLEQFVGAKFVSPRLGLPYKLMADQTVEKIREAAKVPYVLKGPDFYRIYYYIRMQNWAGDRLSVLNRFFYKYSPLNEWDVAQRLIQIPRSRKLHNRLMIDLIRVLDKGLLNYPSQYGDLTKVPTLYKRVQTQLNYGKNQFRYLFRRFRRGSHFHPPSWAEIDLLPHLHLKVYLEEVEELLKTRMDRWDVKERMRCIGLSYFLSQVRDSVSR